MNCLTPFRLRAPGGAALLALTLGALSGCARTPIDSFASQGFRGAKVVFVADSADVTIKDESPRFKDVPLSRRNSPVQPAVRSLVARSLSQWGQSCKSQFIPKSGSYDPRMGLTRSTDGWNVGDAHVLRTYTQGTGTDFLVVLNRVNINRSELERSGAGAVGRIAFSEVALDISVIDTRLGKRVWRSTIQGRTERADSLEQLAGDAVELATDNFFVSLPEARRWGCAEQMESFH